MFVISGLVRLAFIVSHLDMSCETGRRRYPNCDWFIEFLMVPPLLGRVVAVPWVGMKMLDVFLDFDFYSRDFPGVY